MSIKLSIILTIMVTSLFFNIVGLSVIMSNEEDISEYKAQLQWLEEDRDLYQQSSIYWQEQTTHYKGANEALLNVCSPSDITRAAKKTPLPKMEG